MTTLFSTLMTANQTPGIPRGAVAHGRVALVALWLLQIALAAMFMFVGGLKLTGATQMVALFDAIGMGQWLRYVTGSIEVVSAVALLVPGWAAFETLLLIPTMTGAVVTHLFIVGGSAVPATVLLVGSLVIAWARRDQLASVLSTRK
jgi:putative oxidoreductase